MKKLLICAFLLIPFAGLKAQVLKRSSYSVPVYSIHEPHFGIIGGIQASSFHNADVGDPGFQFGFHAGFAYSIPLRKRASFEPQLLYSKKGGEVDYAYSAYNHESINYRLHYLEVPLLLNIHTKNIVDFIIGGYGSYLIDATFNVETNYAYGYGELNYGDFEKYDCGLVGGIGFNFPFSKMSIKYSHGFIDVVDNVEAYPYLEGVQNNMITLSFTGFFRRDISPFPQFAFTKGPYLFR